MNGFLVNAVRGLLLGIFPFFLGVFSVFASEPLGTNIGKQDSMPVSFSRIVKQVRPAVVSIKAKIETKNSLAMTPGIPDDHPLNDFFKHFFDEESRGIQGKEGINRHFGRMQGSGFIISEDGYVVTNNHVIDDAVEIGVVMEDGTEYTVTRVGVDPKTDLALLKIDADKPFPYVAFSKVDVEIGDWVIAVGNPFGLGGSVTTGIVSARGRDIGAGPYDDFIQIDAPINRGNSGGPAFNLNGEVVGVNTAIFSPSGGNVGIAFAIPASVSVDIIDQLKLHGDVKRGWLGVRIQKITKEIAESLDLSSLNDADEGVIIADVAKDGPAQSAGLKEGDLILEVNGHTVESAKDIVRKIAAIAPGNKVKLLILRNGSKETIKVKLANQPSNPREIFTNSSREEVRIDEVGLTVVMSNDGVDKKRDFVLVAQIDSGSEAEDKGLHVGDVILEVGGVLVTKPSEVLQGIELSRSKGRKAVLMRILSAADDRRYVALSIKEK